ncbi:hypothetical protein GIS00_17575 [Nakamurella sp. YIM 132087]|uniref:FAD-binding FR-type domain-containing protein n=1 Tax=Nakamurella alba TaxID=2665158 RepID=A0A7K1FNK0_9ACTN|nr:hypothetical protein [Nakamurella alba]MTD15747.1 hypothetical protein [Nakamurella alba]
MTTTPATGTPTGTPGTGTTATGTSAAPGTALKAPNKVIAGGTTLLGRLDRMLGRVTMYRLVLIVLAVLAVYSIVLAAFDVLFFSPGAMLVSLAIAAVTVYGSSWIAAKVVGAHTHLESSLITALLLFFLLWPDLSGGYLLAVALAGVFAGLSKFVLAWRGRHIANPAAIGVVLVTVIGQGASVWWVASEALFWPTLVGALLVLFRTRRLGFALIFVIPALLMTIKAQTDFGATLGAGIETALYSAPILFLAGFMLSEPLTQAPLRWQRAVVALVVAFLYVQPLYFPDLFISFTPELALVVGNVIAFCFGQRKGLDLTLRERKEIAPGLHELTFSSRRKLRSRAGQYLELQLPHRADSRGTRRVFSLVSSPNSDDVAIATRVPAEKSSTYKQALAGLEPGQQVRATGVAGDFLLPRRLDRKVALVAGGIGVTPFVAQVRHLRETGEHRDVVMIYATASTSDLAYLDELGGVPGVVVSPDRPPALPAGWSWHQAPFVGKDALEQSVPDLAERSVYVSGPPAMVAAVRRSAKQAGARRVHTDAFTGY